MDISVNGTKMAGLNPWWAGSRAPAAPLPRCFGVLPWGAQPRGGTGAQVRAGVGTLTSISLLGFCPAFIHSLQK